MIDVHEKLNIEDWVRKNGGKCHKPDAKIYVIRIDEQHYEVDRKSLTGAEILRLAGKSPNEFCLFQIHCSHGVRPVDPCDEVSFVEPGIEAFSTLRSFTPNG